MSNVILYACIARESNLLVEYSLRTGNFTTIIYKILKQLSRDDQTMAYAYEKFHFNIKVYNFITYLCLTNESTGRMIPFAFLDDVCNVFDPIQHDALEVGKFGWTLHEKMKQYSNTKFEFQKIAEIRKDVGEVRKIMVDNIEHLMERDEKLKELENVAEVIEEDAKLFRRKVTVVKEQLNKWGIVKKLAICGCVILAILGGFVIWYLACGGFNFQCGRIPSNTTLANS